MPKSASGVIYLAAMNGVAGGLEPCPYCGEQHPEAMLACPTQKLQLPLAGRLLGGKFRFHRLLGEGGMGWVWAAENIFVKKEVAIKLMRPEFASSPQILGRFRNEATAAGQIGSPHICDILDFGQSELGPYIVMELMRGRPLDDLITASGRLDPGLAVLIMRQTLEGLDAAHRAGIIHRDLKPENIFLSEPTPGRLLVKLVDFGISKFSQGESSGKTGVGVLMGTPEYMSPEQSEGAANVDERTDIWAMGLILFKALTGIDAFGGPTIAATLVAVATREPPSLAELAPHIPAELAAVINRCIQKDPAQRYASARELSDALAPFENLPPAPVHVPQTTSHAHPAVGASMPPAGSAPHPMSLHPTRSAGEPMQAESGGETQASNVSLAGAGPSPAGTPPPGFTTGPVDAVAPISGSPTWGTENLVGSEGAADSWSMGRAASIEDRRTDGREKSSSGGKGLYIVVLLLILGAVGAGVYFAFGPGAQTDDPPPENPEVVAVASTSGASAGESESAGETGTTGATTGATESATGSTTESSTESDSESSSSTGDDTDDTGSATKKKKKKPNPDKSLVVAAGSYFAPKSEAANSTLEGAKSYCAKLKKNRFARLGGWKLASSKEVLKFAGKSEISKYLYWTRDKAESEGNGIAVLMVSKKSTERPVDDKRARPFCVATS